jgi:chitin disaccharide deacetylase
VSGVELIVNADDFGLSDGVNAGVLRAHRDGIVTSASLMVRGPSAARAAALAAAHPTLSIGLHLDIAEWERRAGVWRPVYLVADPDDECAVRAAAKRQLRWFRSLVGADPTHLDSHQHVHRDGAVLSVATSLATELGVRLRHRSSARYCGAFYGNDRDGAAIPDAVGVENLLAIVDGLGRGVHELCCHPAAALDFSGAYRVPRLTELRTLCDPRVRAGLAQRGVRLSAHSARGGTACAYYGANSPDAPLPPPDASAGVKPLSGGAVGADGLVDADVGAAEDGANSFAGSG